MVVGNRRLWLVVLCEFVLLLSLSMPAFGQEEAACTIEVQPGESIQAAIDAAPEGTVICIAEGTWEENLKITKSLTLRGMGNEKMAISGTSSDCPTIDIESSEHIIVTIEHMEISEGRNGIELTGYTQLQITGCGILENEHKGILLLGLAQAEITDCTVSRNYYGIELQDSAQARITGCTISKNCSGIQLEGSSQAEISENVIEANAGYAGCGIGSSSRGKIHGEHGIALYQWPCFWYTDKVFTGHVSGSNNVIPGPEKPDGNQEGALCPAYPGAPWPEGFLEEE